MSDQVLEQQIRTLCEFFLQNESAVLSENASHTNLEDIKFILPRLRALLETVDVRNAPDAVLAPLRAVVSDLYSRVEEFRQLQDKGESNSQYLASLLHLRDQVSNHWRNSDLKTYIAYALYFLPEKYNRLNALSNDINVKMKAIEDRVKNTEDKIKDYYSSRTMDAVQSKFPGSNGHIKWGISASVFAVLIALVGMKLVSAVEMSISQLTGRLIVVGISLHGFYICVKHMQANLHRNAQNENKRNVLGGLSILMDQDQWDKKAITDAGLSVIKEFGTGLGEKEVESPNINNIWPPINR